MRSFMKKDLTLLGSSMDHCRRKKWLKEFKEELVYLGIIILNEKGFLG